MSITLAYDPMTSEAASRAIDAVRHAFHGTTACELLAPRKARDRSTVGALFSAAQDAMVSLQGGRGLVVGLPGAVTTTLHEQRLLQAVTAAQDEEDDLVDNLLCKLASHTQARPVLTQAVTTLASSLAACGQWLPPVSVPAPALRLMRLRGIDPARLTVSWPVSGAVGVRWAGDIRCGAPS